MNANTNGPGTNSRSLFVNNGDGAGMQRMGMGYPNSSYNNNVGGGNMGYQ